MHQPCVRIVGFEVKRPPAQPGGGVDTAGEVEVEAQARAEPESRAPGLRGSEPSRERRAASTAAAETSEETTQSSEDEAQVDLDEPVRPAHVARCPVCSAPVVLLGGPVLSARRHGGLAACEDCALLL